MATVCANIIWSFFRESLDILMYIKGTVHSVLFLVIPLGIAFHCFEKGNICFTRNSFFSARIKTGCCFGIATILFSHQNKIIELSGVVKCIVIIVK